jgi:hypothetical protein
MFGGLRLYGFWPLDDIYIYDFQWTGIKEDGLIDPHPKKVLDYILLKDDVYGCRVEKAEDKILLPLDITAALTIRIVNPYKALFNVQNWNETVMNRVRPYIRDFFTTKTYKELVASDKRIGDEVYSRLEEEEILIEFQDRYGVDLRKIEVKDIDPGEEFRKATLAKYLGKKEREKRAEETIGSLIEMISIAEGVDPEDVSREIRQDPDMKEKFGKIATDLVHRRMAIDGKSFTDIRVEGAKGIEKGLLELLAFWKKFSISISREGDGKIKEEK